MAAKLPEGVFAAGGKGKKPCPHDGSHFLAARAVHCPKCDKAVAPKVKKAGKKGAGSDMTFNQFIELVEKAGGVAKVRKSLTEIAATREKLAEEEKALKDLGGIGADQVKEGLDLIEKMVKELRAK